MNATRTTLSDVLWRWQRGIARALLLTGALAGMTLGTVAYAQIAFRSASSAGVASTVSPQFRAAASAGVPASSMIAFRAAASAAENSGVLTLTISKPTGTVQNDVMVASIGFRPATATVTPPSGWTPVRSVQNTTGSGPPAVNVYRKVAGASEPASYDWMFSSSTGSAGGIQTFSGVDTTTPVDVENGAPTAAAYDHATPSITTTVANTMLVTSHFTGNRDLWADPPTWGGTQGFQVRAATSPAMAQGAFGLQAAIGATGTKTATDLGPDAADTGATHILALRFGASLTINKPAGTIQNDVMIASIGFRPNTVTITPPAGWTLVRRMDNANATANSLAVYRRVAGASEPASYTWTLSAHTGAAGGIQSFSGVDTTTPIDVENGAATAAATATPATPSVITTVANTMLVTSHSIANDDLWENPPTWGGTQGFQVIAPGGAPEMTQGSFALQAAAGATGTKTATDLGPDAADNGNAHILALRPAVCCLTINIPTGTIQDDVMIASVAVRPNTVTITPPSGWTLIRTDTTTTGPTEILATYQKVAGASEPASYTWGLTASTGAVGGILSFSGVDTTTPIDVSNGQVVTGTTNSTAFDVAAPSVTTTVANTMLVTAHAVASSGTSGSAWTPPTGMTEAVDISSSSGTGGESIELNHVLQASAGATGTKTATVAGHDGPEAVAQIIALRPQGVGLGAVVCASAGGGNATLDLPGVNLTNRNGVVVFVGYNNDNLETVTSVVIDPGGASQTSMGAALADIFNTRSGNDDGRIYIFGLVNPPQGTFTIRVTFSAALATSRGSNVCAYPLSGVNTANPFFAPGTNEADSASGNVTVPSAAGELVLAGIAGETIGTSTVAAPAIEDADIQGGSGGTTHHLATAHQDGAAPNVTITWTHLNDHWAAAGISVRAASGGALPPGSFNAFETSTTAGAITGVIRTRIAGVAFSLDVVAISSGAQFLSFTDQVSVELLGNNTLSVSLDANNCPTSFTLLQTVVPNPVVTGGRSTASFAAVPNSWRDVRARMRWPVSAPTLTSCSTDNFAIRPNALASFSATDNDWQTAGTSRALSNTAVPGGTVHKAGRPFTVRATAVNGAGTPATTTNYAGVAAATVSDCGASSACPATLGTLSLATTFAAGQLSTNTATYSEVGSFALQLVDSSFAIVDVLDSSAAEREISSATIDVGRFVPDHFAVSPNAPLFGTACSGFTYIGQVFNYVTAPVMTVTAQNFTNGTTANYAGALWQITNASLTGKAYSAAVGTLDTSGLPGTDPVIAPSGAGVGTLSFGSGSGLLFTRTSPTAPVSPYDADISLGINVIDADNVAYASNPARFGTASPGLGIAFDGGNAMRFGRLVLQNAYGPVTLALRVPMQIQYWSGAGFTRNTADACTTLNREHIALSGYTLGLAACETAVVEAAVAFSGGQATLTLAAAGAGNTGSVLLTPVLGALGAEMYCPAQGGAQAAASSAGRAYLQGKWTGAAWDENPAARAAFGLYGSQPKNFIFFRENY